MYMEKVEPIEQYDMERPVEPCMYEFKKKWYSSNLNLALCEKGHEIL